MNSASLILIFVLAWCPFPLGSNREWSWALLVLLVGLSWVAWLPSAALNPGIQFKNLNSALAPLALAGGALLWALIQSLPVVPTSWAHPLWFIAGDILKGKVLATVSLNPWRTQEEVIKLASYLAIAWLSFDLSRDAKRASAILNCFIWIGAFYALYAVALSILHIEQFELFYSSRLPDLYLSGPFVQRNTFATYEGIVFLASLARLFEAASEKIVSSKGVRRLALTALRFTCGTGMVFLLPAILSFSVLIGSASRAGVASTLAGLVSMLVLLYFCSRRTRKQKWLLTGSICFIGLLLGALFIINGVTLSDRIIALVNEGGPDKVRTALWAAASRMISSSPLLGLGLGTFQDAYPLYATQTFPFVMDKAHSDYLEFAAGIGLPAAICWWSALTWVLGRLLIGTLKRRRRHTYGIVAISASVLVGLHSAVDFSLQIPAVALSYALLLGVGLAQASSSKTAQNQ